ncbi:uncharacterized protein LOC106067077 [Biomphalaria glabrata]|uniref:Uncharacterized protein LOC106067077 n=1 Tax=Biomphalaria glabrata TaxID=6526 RepID=A0A9W2YP17_BIOGL|nr:uncharacterized protein LOC106067077 [Biomphalaria glabrata]
MATVKTKKRMMYAVFVIIFISGGVEYAVILPTLWLYLHTSYDSPEYMLGLVLSAYSVAAFFSSPLFGRLSDRIRCTKQIFLVCSTFELVGSFLYFVGISQWLCVGSRFISGFGAASEAIALAEVSRYTTEKERTGIISNLVASRQIALLIGPGLNVFLREANFTIGIFEVNKFSSPGAFMVIMWSLLLLIILTLYTEPKHIYAEIETENRRDRVQGINVPSPHNEPNTETSQRHEERGAIATEQRDHTVYSTDSVSVASTSSFQTKDLLLSCEQQDFVYPPLSHDTASQGHKELTPRESPFPSDTSDSEASSRFHDTRPPTLSSEDSADTITNENEEVVPGTPKFELSCSMDLLISAERIINSSHWVNRPLSEIEHWKKDELYFDEDHFGLNVDSTDANERSPLMGRHSVLSSSNSRFMKSQGYNEPYIERSLSALLDDPIAREGKMGFFCNEYIRDEIIAIVCLLFCAMFSQVCVETMVLPLTLKYLDFDELQNSLLYCACGVEIIIVFLIMSRLSRCLSDRVMMMFGAIMILASNIWLLWYLPRAPPHNLIQNLPYFTIAVFLDILSLPFLLVCSTSLYSKLTRKETAGLSQGLRRGVVGLGTIIAPLWGSSAVNQPYVLLGVLVALQALSLVLCVLSFKRLVPTADSSVRVVSPSTSRTRSPAHSSSFRNYSSNSNNANIQVPNSRSAHSTPYGSIQRSLAGSSYHSVNSLAEDRALLRA